MGFERSECVAMLKLTHNDVAEAAQHLLDNTTPPPDSSDDSDTDEDIGPLQRCLSAPSAAVSKITRLHTLKSVPHWLSSMRPRSVCVQVLRDRLVGGDGGTVLLGLLGQIMRRAYELYTKTPRLESTMCGVVVQGLQVAVTLLGQSSDYAGAGSDAALAELLQFGPCALLCQSDDKERRAELLQAIKSVCDISPNLTDRVFTMLLEEEWAPAPGTNKCTQYFNLINQLTKEHDNLRHRFTQHCFVAFTAGPSSPEAAPVHDDQVLTSHITQAVEIR
jgi:hypothetical protein